MTTAARGLTTRRVVPAFAPRDGVTRRHDPCIDRFEQLPISIEAPALRAQQRDHAWVESAARAGVRLGLG